MKPAKRRLFTPGDGATPPLLSGREEQQAVLSRCLFDLLEGESPPHNVVLIGPRGNGKTVLLNWFKRECRASGAVDVAALTPHDVPDSRSLVAELSPPSTLTRLLPRKVGIATVGSLEWQARTDAPARLTRRLIARCSTKPLVVLLDEAHTLDIGVGSLLLNASQQVRDEAPFLLVLAGTPGLPSHLAKMDASFWNRLGAGRLGVGRLSMDATRTALHEPLQAQNVHLHEAALAQVVDESQSYPYFVQLWGEALWQQHSAAGATSLTTRHVDVARPVVSAQAAEYYQDRYRELEAARLLAAAVAVRPVFDASADAEASDREIDAALATTGADAAARLAARDELNRLGYIWCPPGQLPPVTWRAGILSLMAHVQRQFALAKA